MEEYSRWTKPWGMQTNPNRIANGASAWEAEELNSTIEQGVSSLHANIENSSGGSSEVNVARFQ